MLMNQCWPNRARVSSSASWKHSGDRDAVKLTARLQNTLTYYQTILGNNSICGAAAFKTEQYFSIIFCLQHPRQIQAPCTAWIIRSR